MAKSIKELLEDQRAFEQQKEAPFLADSASTRAPSELSTAGPLIEQDDDDKLERLFKSVGIEVGGGITLGGATAPLLGGGPVGIGSYIAFNALGNLGFNAWAQDVRDPEAEYSKEEGIATTLVGTLGPFATIKKGAQLGKIGKRVLGTAEGAALGASEEAIRQGLELQSGKIKFEELSPTQIGWAGGFGAGFGTVATAYSDVNFNKLGASNKTLNEIKRGAELNAVNRLNTIDRTLKDPQVTGELRTLLLKEKDELKTSIESIKLDDREYLQGLREKALEEQKEIEQAIAERLRTSEGTQTGEGTVLRPKEETGEPAEAPQAVVEEDNPVKQSPQQKKISDPNSKAYVRYEPREDGVAITFIEGDETVKRSAQKTLKYLLAAHPSVYTDTTSKGGMSVPFLQMLQKMEARGQIKLQKMDGENGVPLMTSRINKAFSITKENGKYLQPKDLKLRDGTKMQTQFAYKITEVSKKLEAKPSEAPTTQKAVPLSTQQPTKLTTEQKMEAIERMGMSDDDLSMFLEGKSELIPINLAAFTGEDGIQKSMAAVLEQLSDKIKSGRIKTDKESLIKQAAALRKKLDPSLDESAYVTQIAGESEDLIYKTVLADSMTFSAFSNWNKKFDANVDLNDPKVVNDLLGDLDRLQVFAESSSTIGSSAGKLLQSRKLFKEDIAANINTLERKADKLEKGLAEDLIKYSKDLKPGQLKEQLEKLGGLKAMKGFLSELRLIKDPAKLGRLLEISKRSTGEKFGRAAKELVYDSVLSAPPTQAAAASGNAMMSLYSLFNQGVGGLATGDLKQTRMALRTSKYLLHGIQDAWDSAVLASKHSQGSISLNTHYEKIGEKAFAMEATGLKGPIGETVENVGEMLNFGPKGLVFQDEFYRHLFGKAQARAMLAEEYKQLVKKGEAPVEGINDFMNAKMSRYFVDGKRYKTKRDVELEAVTKAREQDLEPKEAKEFMAQYVKDNWNNKLSSELEYVKDFGDKITFQRDLSSEYGVLEAGATKLGELRQKSSVLELIQLFLKTPTNMFMELGGTTSSLALLPGVNKVTFKRTIDELQSENPSIRAQARGRQIVGAGLWASALYLADQQLFTGQGPQDYKELQNKKDTGWQPNALNISATKRFWDTGISNGDQLGDKYMPMARLGAIADVYGVAATALRAHEDNSMPDDWLGQLTSTAQLALSALISDKTYLKNISEFNDGIFKGKWEEGGKSGINTIMSSINRLAVPSLVRGSAALNDPYLREINGPMDQLKMALGSTRRELSPKRDVLGIPKPSSPYNSIGNAINYLSPLRVSELKTEKATKKDVKEGRALKVGDKMFTKQDEAKRIIAELNGRFSFSRPTDGVPGLDLRKLKVSKDYGFGLEQNLYDRWQQIYSELKPEDAIIKLYNHPKIQRLGNVPKGSPIKDLRKLSIESELGKIRKTALGKLIKETPLLKEQYKLINKIQKETSIEGKDAPRKVMSPALEVLTD